MYHTVEFSADVQVDLEISRTQRLERMLIRRGAHVAAQLRPHVAESEYGPVEVADLFFEDGSATRDVPFACFRFVD